MGTTQLLRVPTQNSSRTPAKARPAPHNAGQAMTARGGRTADGFFLIGLLSRTPDGFGPGGGDDSEELVCTGS
jgi:hypothetical protein